MPQTASIAAKAAALPGRTTPPTPKDVVAPVQAAGVRPSRALPYQLDAALVGIAPARVEFRNTGRAGAVFHAYDLRRPLDAPRRYTVGPGKMLAGEWPAGDFDIFVIGPNGFHRRYVSGGGVLVALASAGAKARLTLTGAADRTIQVAVSSPVYGEKLGKWSTKLSPRETGEHAWNLSGTAGWYDLTVTTKGLEGAAQRLAGRVETGAPSISDPAMGGGAVMRWA